MPNEAQAAGNKTSKRLEIDKRLNRMYTDNMTISKMQTTNIYSVFLVGDFAPPPLSLSLSSSSIIVKFIDEMIAFGICFKQIA